VLALKLASLAQGVSGVRWPIVERLAEALSIGLVPVLPSGTTDRISLAHLAGALISATGEIQMNGDTRPAAEALERAGLPPLDVTSREADALLGGAPVATALTIAGLFEAEAVLQSALVAGALSSDALRASESVLHPRVFRLRRHRGQMESATALRALLARGPIRVSKPEARPPEAPEALRIQAEWIGASLGTLRQMAEALADEANSVAEDMLVIWQSAEIVTGSRVAAPLALAADAIAGTLADLGTLAERRIDALFELGLSRRKGSKKSETALSVASLRSTAKSLAAENRERAQPVGLQFLGDAAGDAEQAAILVPGARRLLPVAGNVTLILAIELMAAAAVYDFKGRKRTSAALQPVRDLLRARAPQRGNDPLLAPDLAAVADIVRSGAIARATGVDLPNLTTSPAVAPKHLGARGKRP
jgi:histidine ammonia-lyase